MTEETSTRKVLPAPPRARTQAGGVVDQGRRPVDASALGVPAPAPAPPATEPAAEDVRPQSRYELTPPPDFIPPAAYVAPAPPAQSGPQYAPAPAQPTFEEYETPYSKMTFRIPTDLRDRFRATFSFTAAEPEERDPSMGHLVADMIEAECIRRENKYNGGKPFPGGSIPLLRGRRPSR